MSDSQARLTVLLESGFKQEIKKTITNANITMFNDGYNEILRLGVIELKKRNKE